MDSEAAKSQAVALARGTEGVADVVDNMTWTAPQAAEGRTMGQAIDDATITAAVKSKLLADTYAVYLKTHGYHWNVRGANFAALHQLFMTQYTEMWTAIEAFQQHRIDIPAHIFDMIVETHGVVLLQCFRVTIDTRPA